jgi:Ca2+/H+ antiporter, TMEM165/GDT1 family
MSFDKILFAFVIVLALTLNVGFVVGDIDDITHHDKYELALAIVVSLIATVMKFGDRSLLGSTMLATSLVADVQLIAAAVVWASATLNGAAISEHDTVIVVSLAIGAMVANVISVVLLLIETASLRR